MERSRKNVGLSLSRVAVHARRSRNRWAGRGSFGKDRHGMDHATGLGLMTIADEESRLDPVGSATVYDRFRGFAHTVSLAVGAPWVFGLSLLLVIVWLVTGPFFHYSDTWQLTINTGTTVVTFLMVFVIQNTQNRDSQVVQLKLDELIRA